MWQGKQTRAANLCDFLVFLVVLSAYLTPTQNGINHQINLRVVILVSFAQKLLVLRTHKNREVKNGRAKTWEREGTCRPQLTDSHLCHAQWLVIL